MDKIDSPHDIIHWGHTTLHILCSHKSSLCFSIKRKIVLHFLFMKKTRMKKLSVSKAAQWMTIFNDLQKWNVSCQLPEALFLPFFSFWKISKVNIFIGELGLRGPLIRQSNRHRCWIFFSLSYGHHQFLFPPYLELNLVKQFHNFLAP